MRQIDWTTLSPEEQREALMQAALDKLDRHL